MDTVQKLAIPIAIVIAGALIAGAVYFASIGRVPVNAGAATPPPQVAVDIKNCPLSESIGLYIDNICRGRFSIDIERNDIGILVYQ